MVLKYHARSHQDQHSPPKVSISLCPYLLGYIKLSILDPHGKKNSKSCF